VTVTWSASPSAGVTGYTVSAQPGPATCSTTSPTATSCIIGATAGQAYTYVVVAHGASGDSAASPASDATSAAAPAAPGDAPSGAPTTLTTPAGPLGQVTAGQDVTLVGDGFLARSTVTLVGYSDPVVLGTAVAGADGTFTQAVHLPSGWTVGAHDLVAIGVDASGAARQIRMPVTVPTATLPFTGSSPDGLLTAAVVLLGLGALLVTAARPRRRARS
jgi:titin